MAKNNNKRQRLIGQKRRGAISTVMIAAVVIAIILASFLLPRLLEPISSGNSIDSSGNEPASFFQENDSSDLTSDRIHRVDIRKPTGPPRVDTGLKDAHGNSITVSCATCHATRMPNFENKTAADMDEFHKKLAFSHGSVSCLSCHNSNDYDALKLADGARVEFTDVMTLCAQCHGPQMRDFEHGAHGGMNGFWNLKYGPQVKNNCVDCHNPHSPQFQRMKPTFKPKDRFLEKEH